MTVKVALAYPLKNICINIASYLHLIQNCIPTYIVKIIAHSLDMSQYRTWSATAQSRSGVETEELEQEFDTTIGLAEVRTYVQ